jgi:hypothetical protein
VTDEEESFNFPHKVGDLIMDELVVGKSSKYDIGEDGKGKIRAALKDGLGGPDQEKVAKTITEVSLFLEMQGGSEAVLSLTKIVESLNEPEPEGEKAFAEIEPETDEVEGTIGRSAAAAVVGTDRVKTAPKVGEEKPEGAVSLQDLIGSKRRI